MWQTNKRVRTVWKWWCLWSCLLWLMLQSQSRVKQLALWTAPLCVMFSSGPWTAPQSGSDHNHKQFICSASTEHRPVHFFSFYFTSHVHDTYQLLISNGLEFQVIWGTFYEQDYWVLNWFSWLFGLDELTFMWGNYGNLYTVPEPVKSWLVANHLSGVTVCSNRSPKWIN